MKVNQDLHFSLDKRNMDQKNTSFISKEFKELMSVHGNKLQMEQLNKLLSDIEIAGNRLSKSRNFNELSKYKLLVKKFIHEAVDQGMNMKQSNSWGYNGDSRPLKIVEQVDESLIQLANEIVDKESSTIDILAKIGEIKGLLINLYT